MLMPTYWLTVKDRKTKYTRRVMYKLRQPLLLTLKKHIEISLLPFSGDWLTDSTGQQLLCKIHCSDTFIWLYFSHLIDLWSLKTSLTSDSIPTAWASAYIIFSNHCQPTVFFPCKYPGDRCWRVSGHHSAPKLITSKLIRSVSAP